ncbi:MAG: ABC transporter substrate-binding protein [Patescibacteria group bacterium]|jgi:branched-chain amino acid transport system substrate-binding protein
MKKYAIGLIILITLAGVSRYYANSNDGVERIKVGVLAPLSGNYAIFGERIQNAVNLAKDDLGSSASNIDIIYEDACQGQQAISAAQKLIQIDKISWFAGSFCLVGLVPIIPIVEENGLFIFNIAANPDAVLNQPSVLSTNKSIRQESNEIADFAYNKLGARSTAIVYYTTPLGEDYGKYFKKFFTDLGGTVISDQKVQLEQTDFRSELTKIKALHPDLTFVVHLSNPLGLFLKQAHELGVTSKLLSHSEAEDPNMLEAAGRAAEGLYISSSEPKKQTNTVLDFEKRYKEKYGTKPDIIAANAYDAFTLQVLAYQKCGKNLSCMNQEIRNTKNYDGVSGTLTMNSDGSTSKPILFKKVQDGQFVNVE